MDKCKLLHTLFSVDIGLILIQSCNDAKLNNTVVLYPADGYIFTFSGVFSTVVISRKVTHYPYIQSIGITVSSFPDVSIL
jgi:hypothetical protein